MFYASYSLFAGGGGGGGGGGGDDDDDDDGNDCQHDLFFVSPPNFDLFRFSCCLISNVLISNMGLW